MNLPFEIIDLQRKKQSAQKEVFEKYGSRFFKVINRYVPDKSAAQDIMVDSFIKVFENVGKANFKNFHQFEGWMHRIFVNEALQYLRKRTNYHLRIDSVGVQEEAFDSELISKISQQEILTYIAELPSGYRTVFNLFAIEGYSHKEIAAELGIEVGTSKSQLSHARKLLQLKIKKANEIRKSVL